MLVWLSKHFGGGRRGAVSLQGKCQDCCYVCRVVLKTLVVIAGIYTSEEVAEPLNVLGQTFVIREKG
jgi:hypothetical protein